jgi:uncharacterized protein YbjQ (UPF0145 family)
MESRPDFIVTTTELTPGLKMTRFIGLVSSDFVVGTGPIAEGLGILTDLIGKRGGAFERKIAAAKSQVLGDLQKMVKQKRGNAIVGFRYQFASFENNRVSVTGYGTAMEVVTDSRERDG